VIYVIFALVVVASFLLMLNQYLKGTGKTQIGAFLGLLLCCLVIASFFVAGWKAGLGAIALCIPSTRMSRRLAARTASWIYALPYRQSGHYPGLPPKPLERISRAIGRPFDITEEIPQQITSGRTAEDVLLDYCVAQAEIRQVMAECKVSRDDLRELYFDLIRAGAGQWRGGHWVAASALAYPKTLRYVLEGKKNAQEKWRIAGILCTYFETGLLLSGNIGEGH